MAGQQSSSNPVFTRAPSLQPRSFGAPGYPSASQVEDVYRTPMRLTMDDIVVKTSLLLAIVAGVGTVSWLANPPQAVVLLALLVGFGLGLVNSFKQVVNPALVVAYAVAEGVFLGAVSSYYESAYHGIVLQAAVATVTMFAGMLALYKTGVVKATPRFTKLMYAALFGVLGLMLVNFGISIFNGSGLGLRAGGGIAILFSIVCIGVASMSFVLDFDMAERYVAAGVEERESWRIAFGLVVTLVWLYLEILRLLSYLQRR